MGGLAWWHWVIIIAAFILIFGAKKLPDAARGLGRSLRILKSEVSAMHEDDNKSGRPAAETDASAAVATPPAQISAGPVVPSAQAPVAPAPAQVPVINGVPVSSDQPT